jgi:hypothetical protein
MSKKNECVLREVAAVFEKSTWTRNGADAFAERFRKRGKVSARVFERTVKAGNAQAECWVVVITTIVAPEHVWKEGLRGYRDVCKGCGKTKYVTAAEAEQRKAQTKETRQ